VLTLRDLNRALLARQLLLERSPIPVARAVERVAGLQAQWEPSPPIGLWTRIGDFPPRALESLVRATLMRGTIHLVTRRDYRLLRPAMVPALRRYPTRYRPGEGDDVEELAERALAFASEPRTRAEMVDLVGDEDVWLYVRFHAPFVRVGERYLSAAAEPFAEPEEGLRHLVRRYLGAFGPATTADLAAWSGLQSRELRPALDSLRLRRFRDERGRELLDLPAGRLPPADTPAPPRLLPAFDNLVLSHADRTRVIADEHRRRMIRAGWVDPVFLLDGFVAGRWRLARGKLELDPFSKLTRRDEAALREEASRLAESASRRRGR
jgi:hypothetical protein